MKYTQVTIHNTSTEQNEILVALLANTGFEGFEETEDNLNAFIKETELDIAALEEAITALQLSYTLSTIPQQNWNAQWERSFEPVVINEFAAVRASFHQPVKNVQHEIIITPKMSFGTGHHATTFLMIEQMAKLNFTGTSVFDFGTGTGVLAILAEKMGAETVYAIDNDEWSIENTNENIAANGCKKIQAGLSNTISATAKYDVILANINLNVLIAHMELIAGICKTGSSILFSGVLQVDETALNNTAMACGINFINKNEKNGWLCIKAIKQ